MDVPPDIAPDMAPDVAPDMAPEVAARCTSSASCAARTEAPVCDVRTGECVRCTSAEDACPPTDHCDDATHTCVPGCHADEGCRAGGATLYCDVTTRACVACLRNEHCPLGLLCQMNACRPGCEPDRGCGAGQTCCDRTCVDPANNPMHCGGCGMTCASAPHGTATCTSGRCLRQCDDGFADCNMRADDGCETDTRTSTDHCGACGAACAMRSHASVACAMRACTMTCDDGFADCNTRTDDGCEADTRTSMTDCGRCGMACAPGANESARCATGTCQRSCNMGFGDCNTRTDDGCEVNLSNSVMHCGACGRACAAAEECVAGVCRSTGLIGYWPFDGNGDDLVNGRTLTLMGGAGFAGGLFGQALDLHGNASQYATRPMDDAVFDFGANDFTVQAWMNYNNTGGEQIVVEKYITGGGPGWTLTKLGGNSLHWYSAPSVVMTSGGLTIANSVWHHMVARRRGSSFAIFYDGVSIVTGTNAAAIADTSNPLLVGRRNMMDGRPFALDGRVDELAIWSRALTDAEITALYNSGAGRRVLP
jgi:hypothetical protein